MRCEGEGKPVTFVLTPGQQHEVTVFEQLMENGAVKRPKCGRPRLLPKRIVADKGYTSRDVRLYLRKRGVRMTIPHRSNERHGRKGPFDKEVYRQRNRVERLINRLKQFRRVATRYEKRGENYRAFLTVAAILLWL